MKKSIIIGLALASTLLVSCKKDFLETNASGSITSETLRKYNEENPNVVEPLQQGMFRGLYSWMYTRGSGGLPGSHVDIGQKGMDLMSDLLCGDFVKSGNTYGWHGDLQQYTATSDKNNLLNYMVWRYYYRIIFTANGVLDNLGGDDASFEKNEQNASARFSMGQALGMRGYAYFYLMQFLTKEYAPEELSIPLYRSPSKEVNMPVVPQKDIYNRIIADLTKSIEYLDGFTRDGKYQVNSDVSRVFLAYTYAAMGDYAKAEALSAEVMNNKEYSIFGPEDIVYAGDPTKGGFNSIQLPGVIWGTDLTVDMGMRLISFWGHIDPFHYSYAAAGEPRVMDTNLYDLIREDDIRAKQVGKLGKNSNLPYNKFYPTERKVSGIFETDCDYIYVRVDEMHLLNAEAKAAQGKDAEARAVLKAYLKDRIADLSFIDGLSGNDLKKEIYNQTRIEFLGEGKSYLAMKRNKATVTFGKLRFDNFKEQSMAYNDDRMFFKIPENEEVNNPNLRK